jgi:hypothetical protein
LEDERRTKRNGPKRDERLGPICLFADLALRTRFTISPANVVVTVRMRLQFLTSELAGACTSGASLSNVGSLHAKQWLRVGDAQAARDRGDRWSADFDGPVVDLDSRAVYFYLGKLASAKKAAVEVSWPILLWPARNGFLFRAR